MVHGEPRMEALARVCDVLARVHRDGGEVIVVTSGAIARGMRVMELSERPSTIRELQAASAVGQGKLYRIYDELLRERDVTSAQVLLDVLRHERAHALPECAPDAHHAARVAGAAGDQRERHDRHR